MRWEFILILNLVVAAAFPWAAFIPRINEFLVLVLSLLSLGLLGLGFFVAWSLNPEGDFIHFIKILLLHVIPSLVSLSFLLFSSVGLSFRWLRLSGALLLSIGISVLAFILTPSMSAMDPFWGLIPGPVDMDPIIDLDFYWIRLWASLLGWGLVLAVGMKATLRPISVTLLLWFPFLVLCQILPGPYSSRMVLETSFPEPSSKDSLQVFSHQSALTREAWLEEFRFIKFEILKRLPAKAPPDFDTPLRIFIYSDDLEKKKWIGAERTQIGNFLRGEMHLSEVELDSALLEHELTHLVHGKLNAPLKTYLDPFWFEGLAVAATDLNPQLLNQQASAIFRVLETQGRPLFWPHFTRFFSELPPQASYRLAGAYASQALSFQEWPWNTPRLSPNQFKQIDVSDEFLAEASRILEQKPLVSDPLRRDCSRLFRAYRMNPKLPDYKMFLKVCARSPLAYEAAFALPVDRELALRLLAKTAFEWQSIVHADLDVLTVEPSLDPSLYANCESPDCKLKSRFLKEGRHRELRKILSESKSLRVDLRRAFLPELKFVMELATLLPRSERIRMFEDVSALRRLTNEEAFLFLRSQIYSAIESGLSIDQRKKYLNQLQVFEGPQADRLRRRLLF